MLPLLLLAAAAPSSAFPAPIAAVQACRAITTATERLACFDRTSAALEAVTKSGELLIVERQEVRKAKRGLFGFALPNIGFLTGNKDDKDDRGDNQVETKVVSAQALRYGKYRFTVEGGAVWETVEADSRFNEPRPGATVLLERGSLGGFYATVNGKGRRVLAKRVG